jgi:hypothetical protein
MDTKAKCHHLKKGPVKGLAAGVFFCLRPPPLLGFCLGWSSNFVGSEPVQIQSVKLLQNMVFKRILPHHTHFQPYTVFVMYTVLETGKGGRVS